MRSALGSESPLLVERPPTVSKERKKSEDKQITFRLSSELHARLETAAEGLELEVSSLLRLLIRQNISTYEALVREIKRKEGNDPDS